MATRIRERKPYSGTDDGWQYVKQFDPDDIWTDEAKHTFEAQQPYAAPQPAESSGHSIQDCPEDDKWNCKYCHRVNACPVQGSRDEQPSEPVKVPSDVRGEVARKLQEANRHLEMSTARYYVDAVCDLLSRYGQS